MKIKKLLETQKFTLEVTMPQSMEFVDAVLRGGAQALKMRCNNPHESALHNGLRIGSFQERKEFLREVVGRAGAVPVGLVPGFAEQYVTEAERNEMEELGIDYFNTEARYAPPYMFEGTLSSVIAVTSENCSDALLRGLRLDGRVDIVEGSVVPMEQKGTRLVYGDILRYRAMTDALQKPVIATGQRLVKPEEVKYFYEAGCKGFMLGVVAFLAAQEEYDGGRTVTPEICLRVTEQFREAVEKL